MMPSKSPSIWWNGMRRSTKDAIFNSFGLAKKEDYTFDRLSKTEQEYICGRHREYYRVCERQEASRIK